MLGFVILPLTLRWLPTFPPAQKIGDLLVGDST